jgi:rhodanese-related sulfurtransferase
VSARFLDGLGLSQRLALVAVALGVGAFAIGDPVAKGRVTLDERELAAIVEGEVDHVTPDELADWIVEGRQDYRLIDLRAEADYAAYHIPSAQRLAITELPDAELPRNEKLVLYSAEGIHSAQAWFLLKARKYPAVYILLGGLKQWNEEVIYPVDPGAAAHPVDRIAFAKAAERARYFGGGPRAAAVPGSAPVALLPTAPPVAKVAPPVVPGGAAPAKKKKEGC